NAEFASACTARGIAFIGPRPETVLRLGDKVKARELAQSLGIPVVPGLAYSSDEASAEAARAFHAEHESIIVKASHGGGGRGIRIVGPGDDLLDAIGQASSEAESSFGSNEVFLEKYLPRVSHIEVQILADLRGNVVHLYERDCSSQRRHQKVVEVAPAPNLSAVTAQRLHENAVKIAKAANYLNAGTVEFLVSGDDFYFIEINPRLQVEHTVTEQITGIDLVQSQIKIAEGHSLGSEKIGIFGQSSIIPRGFAIQCRITSEDPSRGFLPDTGEILAYRSASGPGIRLDIGNGFVGARVSPHYDSLLVKVTAYALVYKEAIRKSLRALREFRIRGLKTNLAFLENLLMHETFQNGEVYTRFIDDTPGLFHFPRRRDRATKLLAYLAEIIVNGHPTVPREKHLSPASLKPASVPRIPDGPPPDGTAQILEREGAKGLVDWIKAQDRPLLTDTTMRDAHQSLLATRMRTKDLLRIAPATAHLAHQLFSVESWGGATFDVAYRFLNESPWSRLRKLKKAMPNLLQQMLLRGANAVGYTSYPDNVVAAFINEAAQAGVDVFRVFDSVNDLNNLRFAVDSILDTPKVAEVCMCYTGDVANPNRRKYDLDYYIDLARRIEDMGAHILCIKDMAGLLRPRAAQALVSRLTETVDIPIHLHTHDTSGNGVAALLEAIEAGVDIVDAAVAPMAGLTSQPSMNAVIAALRGGSRETGMGNKALQPLADYWEGVREFYSPFESGLLSSTSEVYYHEIPGGQYSNLRPQTASLGLLDRWTDVKHAFAVVNQLVGDIPKVTPSSKMVGDFANYLVQNDLLVLHDDFPASVEETRRKVLDAADRLDFPISVIDYFQGHLGNPLGGFPKDLQAAILKGMPVSSDRSGAELPPLDLVDLRKQLIEKFELNFNASETLSAALYPRVFNDHCQFFLDHADVSILDTPNYFYGLEQDQEIQVDIEQGKTLIIKLAAVSQANERGQRTVYFELNGQGRQIVVQDRSQVDEVETGRKAQRDNKNHIGAPMPGSVIMVHCSVGETIEAGDPLITLEAMKMETIIRAPRDGKIEELIPELGASVLAEDLLAVLS
ncbi:MAG: pyruvate carboxylase, partial [Planctomycetota bacterium]|nr:pyruvate carboxylase [Planctomycetota bacterium]